MHVLMTDKPDAGYQLRMISILGDKSPVKCQKMWKNLNSSMRTVNEQSTNLFT